jgi:transposase
MIVPSQRLAIVIATQPVDFRCGHDALAALVQTRLGLDPHSGLMVVFRSKRKDRAKILVWDGSGLVLVYKRLEAGGFSWPRVEEGVARISRAQFEALFDGLEWQRLAVKRVTQPGAAA